MAGRHLSLCLKKEHIHTEGDRQTEKHAALWDSPLMLAWHVILTLLLDLQCVPPRRRRREGGGGPDQPLYCWGRSREQWCCYIFPSHLHGYSRRYQHSVKQMSVWNFLFLPFTSSNSFILNFSLKKNKTNKKKSLGDELCFDIGLLAKYFMFELVSIFQVMHTAVNWIGCILFILRRLYWLSSDVDMW